VAAKNAALKLDMAHWWQPTRESYLGRVSKTLILSALRKGIDAAIVNRLADCKKDILVKEAEKRLAGTGWLPEILRAGEVQAV
jgi:ParB family transcriptional regulator, chromosome partitioning protein